MTGRYPENTSWFRMYEYLAEAGAFALSKLKEQIVFNKIRVLAIAIALQ